MKAAFLLLNRKVTCKVICIGHHVSSRCSGWLWLWFPPGQSVIRRLKEKDPPLVGEIEIGREKHWVLYGMLDPLVFCLEVANINIPGTSISWCYWFDMNTSLLASSMENRVLIPIVKQAYQHCAGRIAFREGSPRDSMHPLNHKAGRELILAKFLLETAFQEGHRVCPLHPLR